MSVRLAIERAVSGAEVPSALLEPAFGEIAAGRASEVEIAALLVALRTKGETQGEICAAARASWPAVSKCLTYPRVSDAFARVSSSIPTVSEARIISHSFSISTIAAVVAAASTLASQAKLPPATRKSNDVRAPYVTPIASRSLRLIRQ